ncbi:adenylate/guanylate cyclase domain-containing protein [Methylovirgula sp. 4M-Z18]|nr:adenylate/guanylate cyclase domain-containing protein [Methylovirgula sp. 4M-Z18]
MERDEAGTHLATRALRDVLIKPTIRQNQGRIVKYTGDGFLAEFPNSLDAVMAAITIQRGMVREAARETPLAFRIGVHVGDIIVDADDIYGDGVNIAARLESFSAPGGIVLSQAVHEQVRHNLAVIFDDLGELHLRNITRSLRLFALPPARIAELPEQPFAAETAEGRKGLAQVRRPTDFAQRLSIAVLPFDNMSSDPQQSYFADGIVEDIIGALSRFRNLSVLPRNVSFIYKGRAVDLRDVGRALNVRYVVEGSVRRAGNRVRITAQLIDTSTGAHLWADYFDGQMAEIFALQDQVTQRIVTSIEPRVRAAEIERAKRTPVENLDAYDCYLRALELRSVLTYESFSKAFALLERSIELDPNYAPALAHAANCLGAIRDNGWSVLDDATTQRALNYANRVIEIESHDAEALCYAAHCIAVFGRDSARALDIMRHAVEQNPNSGLAWARRGMVNVYAGNYLEAIKCAERARSLYLASDAKFVVILTHGMASLFVGDYEQALAYAEETLPDRRSLEVMALLKIFALVKLNRNDQVVDAAKALLKDHPSFTISGFKGRTPFAGPQQEAIIEHCLRSAGLPE